MAWEDEAIAAWTSPYPPDLKYAAAVVGATVVVVWGRWLARRAEMRKPALE